MYNKYCGNTYSYAIRIRYKKFKILFYSRLKISLLQLIDVHIVSDVPDPCKGVTCGPGEQCRPTADAKSYNCECPTSCPSYGDHEGSRPLCASDARDYPGICEMRRAACETHTNITFKYYGKCGK